MKSNLPYHRSEVVSGTIYRSDFLSPDLLDLQSLNSKFPTPKDLYKKIKKEMFAVWSVHFFCSRTLKKTFHTGYKLQIICQG